MAAAKALARELMRLESDPVPGFKVEPCGDDMHSWIVGIFGPPETIYQGGYFKAKMTFPLTYPMDPPDMVMMQPMWHPNIYESGKLCISILHPPGDDPMSGELASERWSPVQSVTTVLLSVISMLNEPNCSSPANVDAGVMYRNKRDEYETIVKQQVEDSKKIAARDNVIVPLTLEEYCPKKKVCVVAADSESDDEKYIVELDSDSEVESDDATMDDSEDDEPSSKRAAVDSAADES